MGIILNEKKRAQEIIESGELGDKPAASLSLVARYYRQVNDVKGKKLYQLLDNFMKKYYNNYNPVKWSETIERLVKTSGKYELLEIDYIPVTEAELAEIDKLPSRRIQRVAFTMLCVAKYYDTKNIQNNHWVNLDDKTIFSLAAAPMTKKTQNAILHTLFKEKYVEFSQKVDNLNTRILYINENSPVVLKITDFRKLGYEYMLYKGERYIRCKNCGVLVRQNKNGTRQYCDDCIGYIPMEYKFIECEDCGERVKVAAKNNKTTRCPECQAKRDREKASERKRKQRSVTPAIEE